MEDERWNQHLQRVDAPHSTPINGAIKGLVCGGKEDFCNLGGGNWNSQRQEAMAQYVQDSRSAGAVPEGEGGQIKGAGWKKGSGQTWLARIKGRQPMMTGG